MYIMGLIKKTLRKFGCVALRNEIVVTIAGLGNLFVSFTKARPITDVGANFILARHSNF